MLLVNTDVRLELWNAVGVLRLLSCALEENLINYKKYNDCLFETQLDFVKPTRRKDWAGVYIFYFRKCKKFYIGSSKAMTQRIESHFSLIKSGRHYNKLILKAFDKNAGELPQVIYIKTFTEGHARKVEQCLIDLVFMEPHCLNQRRQVEEYRPSTEDTRERLSNAAKKQWTEEFRKKIREINKKPENLAKRITNGNKLKQNPDYMKKLSVASKKLWEDPEYAEKIRRSGAAVWDKAGFRERHGAAMRAKHSDPEYRKNATRGLEVATSARRKPVTIGGTSYPCAKVAAESLGMSLSSVRRKCNK